MNTYCNGCQGLKLILLKLQEVKCMCKFLLAVNAFVHCSYSGHQHALASWAVEGGPIIY